MVKRVIEYKAMRKYRIRSRVDLNVWEWTVLSALNEEIDRLEKERNASNASRIRG